MSSTVSKADRWADAADGIRGVEKRLTLAACSTCGGPALVRTGSRAGPRGSIGPARPYSERVYCSAECHPARPPGSLTQFPASVPTGRHAGGFGPRDASPDVIAAPVDRPQPVYSADIRPDALPGNGPVLAKHAQRHGWIITCRQTVGHWIGARENPVTTSALMARKDDRAFLATWKATRAGKFSMATGLTLDRDNGLRAATYAELKKYAG